MTRRPGLAQLPQRIRPGRASGRSSEDADREAPHEAGSRQRAAAHPDRAAVEVLDVEVHRRPTLVADPDDHVARRACRARRGSDPVQTVPSGTCMGLRGLGVLRGALSCGIADRGVRERVMEHVQRPLTGADRRPRSPHRSFASFSDTITRSVAESQRSRMSRPSLRRWASSRVVVVEVSWPGSCGRGRLPSNSPLPSVSRPRGLTSHSTPGAGTCIPVEPAVPRRISAERPAVIGSPVLRRGGKGLRGPGRHSYATKRTYPTRGRYVRDGATFDSCVGRPRRSSPDLALTGRAPAGAGALICPAEQGFFGLSKVDDPELRRITLRVKRDGRDVKVEVRADGAGLVSHAGAALLGETADRLGLTRRARSRSWGTCSSARRRTRPGA